MKAYVAETFCNQLLLIGSFCYVCAYQDLFTSALWSTDYCSKPLTSHYLRTNVTTGQPITAGFVRSVIGPHCPHCQLSLYQADFHVEVVDEEHLHHHSSSEQGQPQVEDRQAGLTGSLTALLLHCDSC